MNLYVVVLLVTAAVAAAMGGALLARGRRETVSRLMAAIMAVAAAWSLLLAAACVTPQREEALGFLRALGLVYPWLGPLALHVTLKLRSDLRALRPLLVLLYVLTPILGALHVATPWFVREAVPTAWGHLYRFGPAFPLAFAQTALGPALAIDSLVRRRRQRPARGTARQTPALAFAIGLPLALVTVSDVLLPAMGGSAPPLGTLGIALVGGGLWTASYRLGVDARAAATFARHILGALPDGVVLLRSCGEVRMANPAFAGLSGRSPARLQGAPIEGLLRETPAADGVAEWETLLARPAGPPVPVRVVAAPLHDRRGQTSGRVLVVRDQREVLALRRRLLTSARRAAVGEMAAGIAHEVNNPLAFIQTNLNHLDAQLAHLGEVLTEADDGDDGDGGDEGGGRRGRDRPEAASRARVAEARAAVARVATVVRDVRSFAHAGSGRPEPHDLNELLESVLRLVTPRLRGRARIERRLGALPFVPCVGQDLRQVLLTLMVDLADAAAPGATLRVATRAEAGFVLLEVVQEGGEQPEAIQAEALTQPLLDRPGAVRDVPGLGRALADEVVRDHGGSLDVEHTPEGTTTVRMRLPLTERRAGGAAPPEEGPCTPRS